MSGDIQSLSGPSYVKYFENLDGLRAIAAFAVVFAHISSWFEFPDTLPFKALKFLLYFNGTHGGRFGVIFFFVLSGFLITYLMFIEKSKTGHFKLGKFYVRRALRIWPLYFFSLIIGFVLYPMAIGISGPVHHENANWEWYSLFIANFDHIYNGFPTANILGVHWSVCVEEQFYLLWPLVFIAAGSSKHFPWVCIGLVLSSEIFHALVGSKVHGGDYHFISCVRYLSIGGLLAWFAFYHRPKLEELLSRISKQKTRLFYALCITIMLLEIPITMIFPGYKKLFHLIPMLFFAFVIAEQNFGKNSFFKISSIPLLTWLGKISYSIYLLHMVAINIIFLLFTNSSDFVIAKAISAVLLTVLISNLSYKFIESPFLKLKNKFSS
ncbi:MAG: acyltransferase family protein [Bacteroidota bacterium]